MSRNNSYFKKSGAVPHLSKVIEGLEGYDLLKTINILAIGDFTTQNISNNRKKIIIIIKDTGKEKNILRIAIFFTLTLILLLYKDDFFQIFSFGFYFVYTYRKLVQTSQWPFW